MNRKALPPLSPECEELRERLEHWRNTREKRSRIPDDVWESAARLAREHGTNRIARALRLSHATLKNRMNGSGEHRTAKRKSGPAFVKLDVCQLGSSEAYVVELAKRSGEQMRIELKGGALQDILTLMEVFRSQDS
jgi:hypothetical protein